MPQVLGAGGVVGISILLGCVVWSLAWGEVPQMSLTMHCRPQPADESVEHM